MLGPPGPDGPLWALVDFLERAAAWLERNGDELVLTVLLLALLGVPTVTMAAVAGLVATNLSGDALAFAVIFCLGSLLGLSAMFGVLRTRVAGFLSAVFGVGPAVAITVAAVVTVSW